MNDDIFMNDSRSSAWNNYVRLLRSVKFELSVVRFFRFPGQLSALSITSYPGLDLVGGYEFVQVEPTVRVRCEHLKS